MPTILRCIECTLQLTSFFVTLLVYSIISCSYLQAAVAVAVCLLQCSVYDVAASRAATQHAATVALVFPPSAVGGAAGAVSRPLDMKWKFLDVTQHLFCCTAAVLEQDWVYVLVYTAVPLRLLHRRSLLLLL